MPLFLIVDLRCLYSMNKKEWKIEVDSKGVALELVPKNLMETFIYKKKPLVQESGPFYIFEG